MKDGEEHGLLEGAEQFGHAYIVGMWLNKINEGDAPGLSGYEYGYNSTQSTEQAPVLVDGMAEPTSSTFFSYSREDAKFALRLARDLRSRGASVWLDQLDIEAGTRWDVAVETALARCQSVLVILSPVSIGSQNVMDEVSYALDEGKTVIPVLYQDCKVPFRLRRFQYADFREDYGAALAQLQEVFAAEIKPPATPLPDAAGTKAAPKWTQWLLPASQTGMSGKIARVFFYVLLVTTAFYTLGIFVNEAGDFDWRAPAHDPGAILGGYALLLVLLAICSFLVRRSAATAQRTRKKQNAAGS